MEEIVTVLVPVHNAADYLEASLESLQAQTFTNWKCVCLDDGSTDASADILNRFAAADPRFHVIANGR